MLVLPFADFAHRFNALDDQVLVSLLQSYPYRLQWRQPSAEKIFLKNPSAKNRTPCPLLPLRQVRAITNTASLIVRRLIVPAQACQARTLLIRARTSRPMTIARRAAVLDDRPMPREPPRDRVGESPPAHIRSISRW